MRHLIVEGPDGGGKTRLVEALLAKFPDWGKGSKASTSMGGPVPNLAAWVNNEFKVMDAATTCLVYDRHPVISEPIYGRIVRDNPKPGFTPSPWLSWANVGMQDRVFVIWCIPHLAQCEKAVAVDRDMPGVTENIAEIHRAYVRAMTRWNGPGIRYNLSILQDPFEITEDGLIQGALNWVSDHSPLLHQQVLRG